MLGLATGSAGEGDRCGTRWSTLGTKFVLLRMYRHVIFFIFKKEFSELWENVKLCGYRISNNTRC